MRVRASLPFGRFLKRPREDWVSPDVTLVTDRCDCTLAHYPAQDGFYEILQEALLWHAVRAKAPFRMLLVQVKGGTDPKQTDVNPEGFATCSLQRSQIFFNRWYTNMLEHSLVLTDTCPLNVAAKVPI